MPNGDDQRYDTHEYAGDRAGDISQVMRNMPEEDRSTRTELQQSIAQNQQEQLAPNVEIGNDRVVVPQNWESRSSTELFTAATELNVPTSADGLGRGFTEGGNRLADAANRLLDAVAKLDQAWKGEAAQAARGALTPLAQATGQAGIAAQYMGTAMAQQATAAATVRNLPQPMEFDPSAELTKALANPNPVAGMADMNAKEQEAKAVKAEQVKYLTDYTTTMQDIDSSTPTFVPPPPRIDEGGSDTGFQDSARVNYNGGPGGTRDFYPTGTTGSTGQPGYVHGHGPNPPSTTTPPVGTVGVDTSTTISGYTPPQTSPVTAPTGPGLGNTPPTAPQPTTGNPTPVNQFGRGLGGPPTGTPTSTPGTGRPGPGLGGPRGGLGTGGPGGAGGAGNSGAARPGSGIGAGAGQGGPGGRPGGPGAGGGTGGRGGAGGMGGAGGRGGQGDEDTEHERASFLVEPDPEAAFGTDQVTAPPVIGE